MTTWVAGCIFTPIRRRHSPTAALKRTRRKKMAEACTNGAIRRRHSQTAALKRTRRDEMAGACIATIIPRRRSPTAASGRIPLERMALAAGCIAKRASRHCTTATFLITRPQMAAAYIPYLAHLSLQRYPGAFCGIIPLQGEVVGYISISR